jgi:cystathionine beta-lyase
MVWTKEELTELAEICLQHNILIISDEIHSDLIFPGYKHIPIASLSEEIANNTITFMAPSKTFNLAGLSTSIAITQNTKLREQFKGALYQMHLNNGNIFGNVALEAAYTYGSEWVDQLMKYLNNNLKYMQEFFQSRIPSIKIINPEATYLVWLDCKALKLSNKALKDFMIHQAGLGLSDGILFGPGGAGFQRMNIGCPAKQLEKALGQLEKAVNTI